MPKSFSFGMENISTPKSAPAKAQMPGSHGSDSSINWSDDSFTAPDGTVYVRQRNTAPKTWLDFQNVPQDEPDAETAADNNDMDSSSKSIASTSGLK